MKLLFASLSAARALRSHLLRTAFVGMIAAGLFTAPTIATAQNRHKPTSKVVKPLRNERSEATAPTGQSPLNLGASIQESLTTLVPVGPAWRALGPAPIPNGQTVPQDPHGVSLSHAAVSGRVTAVAIDPDDADTAYVGTAQGGLYQTRDGGATWTALMDSAETLAIGSLELDQIGRASCRKEY